jgi:hypothetical protein
MWEKMSKENPELNASCARAEDLVTYLYGEANEPKAAEFRLHLKQCASCGDELAAFSRVREDVVEWRDRSLPSFETSPSIGFSAATAQPRKRSALAALREFFTLAPAWMRAATAMAAVVICALVVLAVIHFSEPRATVQVVTSAPTQAQVEEMVQRRAEELRQKELQGTVAPAPDKQSAALMQDKSSALPKKTKRATGLTVVRREQIREAPGKAKASREAREQLAELVQSSKDEDSLPRLSDLIDDSNEAH